MAVALEQPLAPGAPDVAPSRASSRIGGAFSAIGSAVAAGGSAVAAGAAGAGTRLSLNRGDSATSAGGAAGSARSSGSSTDRGKKASSIAQPVDFELSSMEAALEAWAVCKPEGTTMPASSVRRVLKDVAQNLPSGWRVAETAEMLKGLFEGLGGDPPVFEQLLKIRSDPPVVHFLDFWRAFSKATHLLTSVCCNGIARDEGLAMELETVRDSILRVFEVQEQQSGFEAMRTPDLFQALQSAAAMSVAPVFWKDVEKNLRARTQQDQFILEELSEIMLSWLQDAIIVQNRITQENVETQSEASLASDSTVANPKEKGTPVYLHIYDVSQEEGVRKLNRVLAHRYSPFKFGGVFHAGVEVNGLEWSYGMSQSETLPGLSCVLPKSHPNHTYRQTVRLHRTKLSAEEVADMISALAEEYPGHDYHLLRRNCCHFADDFSHRIGAGRIPGWVHRLARVGANVDTVMHRVAGRRLLPDDESDGDY